MFFLFFLAVYFFNKLGVVRILAFLTTKQT